MLANNYLLKLSDRIICSSDSKTVLIKLAKKLEKDLGDIEEQFENGKKLLINSGKYPISDPEVDAPVYSKALSLAYNNGGNDAAILEDGFEPMHGSTCLHDTIVEIRKV